MGVGAIAREAFLKVRALEQALISKGILTKGEAEQLYLDEIRKQSEERAELESKFWNQLVDDTEIQLFPLMTRPIEGNLVGKSFRRWHAICLRITEGGTHHKHYKRGQIACFTELIAQDVKVRSLTTGQFEGITV